MQKGEIMPTNTKAASYNAGKKHALDGKKANPAGQHSVVKYMFAYTLWTKKRKEANNARAAKYRHINPVAHCGEPTCKAARREKQFKIYDVRNDRYFCGETCHDIWRTRE